MKKLIAVLIAALMLTGCASAAVDIDLSSLSFDELIELRTQIALEMWHRDEWKEAVAPSGYYEVGSDIPAGRWTISVVDSSAFVGFYKTLPDALKGENSLFSEALFDDETWSVIIEDGMGVNISGEVVFQPYKGTVIFK